MLQGQAVGYFTFACLLFTGVHPPPQFLTRLELHRTFCRNQHCLTRLWIAPFARWPVIQTEAAEAAYLNALTSGECVAERVENSLDRKLDVFGSEMWMGGGELGYKVGAGHCCSWLFF